MKPSLPIGEELRIIAWNIRAGGGKRVAEIAEAIGALPADIALLSEFRRGAAGDELRARLAAKGLSYQCSACGEVGKGVNAVLIASRWPLRQKPHHPYPEEPGRWLLARVAAPFPFLIGAMHIPNQVTGRKSAFHQSLLDLAKTPRRLPLLIAGDTNSGKIGLDEERPVFNRATDAWMDAIGAAGLHDLFRLHHGPKREFTWFSPNAGNGFRLDQAFACAHFAKRLIDVRHVWLGAEAGGRRDRLSDHAALIIEAEFEARSAS